jgi:hypothetical protein
VWGTTWRAIGRGFGNGTFGWAAASTEKADNPTASARLAAKAVVRNAAARADRVTSFLRGESFKQSGFRSIDRICGQNTKIAEVLQYVRQDSGKIAAGAGLSRQAQTRYELRLIASPSNVRSEEVHGSQD